MATEIRTEVPKEETVMNGISSPEEAGRLARNFINALEHFRSEQGYQSLAELVDRIPELEADLQGKDKALAKAGEELGNEKRTHAAERERTLQLYADESGRFRNERVSLEQRISDLQTTVSEKERHITVLKLREEELKASGRKVEETCKGKINQLREKENKLTAVTNQLEGNQS
jgi:chromosome segregation ATPase